MAQSAAGVVAGIEAALQALHADEQDSLVSNGPPGDYLPDLIIAIGDWRAPVTRPTQGPNRSREATLEVDVIFSAFVGGGPEAQQPANLRAWSAAEGFESWLRQGSNPTFDGACRDSWISNKVLTPDVAYEVTDGMTPGVPVGRTAAVTVTVTAAVRY